MTQMIFIVTHEGVSIRCAALLNARAEVTCFVAHALITSAENGSDVFKAACEAAALFNKLINVGGTFEELRTFRNSPGITGAMIDAADDRLQQIRECLHSHNMAVAG